MEGFVPDVSSVVSKQGAALICHRRLAIPHFSMASPSPPEEASCPIKSVAIIGGGVSGLSAAYKLKLNGIRVTLFEAEERAGGKIRSTSHDGLIWDEGANTMTESDIEVERLIDDLDLRGQQQFPISQNKRYVVKNGMPQLIPSNPIALIKSDILSPQSKGLFYRNAATLSAYANADYIGSVGDRWYASGYCAFFGENGSLEKLKIILEPFLWRHSGQKSSSKLHEESLSESVGQFFSRHFGSEVVDYLIDPFVAGTNAADPESLSIRHAFPKLWKMEEKFGSIIVGALRSRGSSKMRGNGASNSTGKQKNQHGSFSFYGGIQTLTDRLCTEFDGGTLKLNSRVFSLSCDDDGSPPFNSWSISYAANTVNCKEQSFDAVVMTAPLGSVQDMKITKRRVPYLLDFLPKVNYLPVSVLITSFGKENVRRPLEGFGVLVPSKEQKNGLRTLGTLFSSMMFPDRAPVDQHLYTTFVGGSRNRDLARASLEELKQIVVSDLRKLLGAEGQPTFVKHIYWKNAFPLYGRDYSLVLEAIDKMERDLPGFFYAGNNRDGLSVGKAIASGCKAADIVISYLNSSVKDVQ